MLLWGARMAAAVAVGVACYLTLSPHPAGAGILPDWVGHLGIFAGVGASFALLRRVSGWPDSRLRWLALIIVALGAATEAGQSFTGRDPALADVAVDVVGGLTAIFVIDAALARAEARRIRGRL